MAHTRSIQEINNRIEKGEATILTNSELLHMLETGEKVKADDVDVVTSATCGLMSGTIAVLSFPIAQRGEFTRAQEVLLNGVPAYPGPCPNERLGVIDLIVYGTSHSISDNRYGGGHLLKDLVSGKAVNVKVKPKDGTVFEKEITINEIPFASLQGIRHCFRNYISMINKSNTPVPSIFHVKPIEGPYKELSVCGCGALNPIANDPKLRVIGVGTKVLINDAQGYITGLGTRASSEKPNLAGYADLKDMDPYYLGGFQTSEGPEVITSWAIPIPIINQEVFEQVCKPDSQEPLPIADVSDRIPFHTTDYGKVWYGTDITVKFNSSECQAKLQECMKNENGLCSVEYICPVNAFTSKGAVLDRKLCFNCGACVRACKCGCFQMKMGEVTIDDYTVPITLRQSDRARAIKLSKSLQKKILNGSFKLTEKVQDLKFS